MRSRLRSRVPTAVWRTSGLCTSRQTNLKSLMAVDGASVSTSSTNVPLMTEYVPSSGQKESPEQLVGQSGEPQRTWLNVEDSDVSNAGSQSTEPEAQGLHRSMDAPTLLVSRNTGNCCSGVP